MAGLGGFTPRPRLESQLLWFYSSGITFSISPKLYHLGASEFKTWKIPAKMQICYLGRSVHKGIVTNALPKWEFSLGRYHLVIWRQGTQEGG